MTKKDFSTFFPDNYEQKCLLVLVLDVSRSMDGAPIAELNRSLQDMYKAIEDDPIASQRVEISLITFNHIVTTVQEPDLVENFSMPTLTASGFNAMVDAVKEAIDKVTIRKAWYKQAATSHYRPCIILISGGEPDIGQDVDGLASIIETDTKARKYVFLPVGTQGSNMSILNRIASSLMPAMPLKTMYLDALFLWRSVDMAWEEPLSLPNPDDWKITFTI